MSEDTLSLRSRLIAIGAVLAVVGAIVLYVREFPVFTNTIHARTLVLGSIVVGLMLAGLFYYFKRKQFSPWERHLPEFFGLIILALFFSPLLGSLLNRGLGRSTHQSFEFLSEKPYVSSSYGLLIRQKVQQRGWLLEVRENGALHRFRYQKQAYYPITNPGDPVLLPIRDGLFGFRVMELR
ncbi:MAG: hypothetical protein KGS48_14385 [Bacteroidetes bacterium]|nr:hypothetical protein [Bacteroidota bacterium]